MPNLRHGGSFFQRRLTQLYTDTKSSCESVSSTPKPSDQPELGELNRNFRAQRDKLLAWGLDWSDGSTTQPHDIDEALNAAGFSDVVASIMSSIQELLSEAEELQHPKPTKSSDSVSKSSNGSPAVKTTWTDEEIARSKVLLAELTERIDTLYDLSRSRRNMSMSMASSSPSIARVQQERPQLPISKDSYCSSKPSDSKASPGTNTFVLHDNKESFSASDRGDMAQATGADNSLAKPTSEGPSQISERTFPGNLPSLKHFYIDCDALHISLHRFSDASNPPPYEPFATSSNSRMVGQLDTSAIPPCLAETAQSRTVPVLVEFSPIIHGIRNSPLLPRDGRLEQICKTIQTLVDNGHVSHLGLLKFIGFFVDSTSSRYAFVYQIPLVIFPVLTRPSDVMKDVVPRPLVSFYNTGDDHQDSPAPNLDVRFKLAYNLVLAFLHLRSQNIIHGNINSHNILIFPDIQSSDLSFPSKANSDFRLPYLSSLSVFNGDESDSIAEPLSMSMYRHSEDNCNIDDQVAWSYDVYSLGLVLLEIGLWTPLSRLWKMKYNNSMFGSRIQNVYVKKLGPKCGNTYMQLVQLCLDAPNFNITSEPMADLALRIPRVYHYPWNDPNQANERSTFSKNFAFTIGKIAWHCANMDIFSPPPAADLDEYLPPPKAEQEKTTQVSLFQSEGQDLHIGNLDATATCDDFSTCLDDKCMERRVRKRTLKKWTDIEIPESHLCQWNTNIMPKITKILQKVLKDSSESCAATLMVAGETVETAKTTICVTCISVKRVRSALKRYFDYDKEQWDLIVLKGDIQRSKVPRRRRRKAKSNFSSTTGTPHVDPNPYYQEKPVCGASIGAFRLDEHLPPASYGGAILVDGIPYGMTVHHMLDPQCDDDDDDQDFLFRSAERTPDIQSFDNESDTCTDDETLPEAGCSFEITDDEDDADDQSLALSLEDSYDEDFWLSDGYSTDDNEDDNDAASVGDVAGIEPHEEPRIIVTQPAIDDVTEEFFRSSNDRDDEHLASHSLGYIYASSGIRRWTRDGVKHEVDWALINIDENRVEASNAVPNDESTLLHTVSDAGRRRASARQSSNARIISLNKIARVKDLAGSRVQCRGRTSGLQSGRISQAMASVKMHGRQSFSTSFTVEGNFGGQ